MSLMLCGCGGGAGGGATITTSGGGGNGGGATAYNVVNAIVDQGPAALLAANQTAVDLMYVNVTICAPGSTTNCQTIDHVQVDTGSQGLRIISSALNSSLLNALPPVTLNGAAVAECTQFVDGYSWGEMVTADVHLGGSDTSTSGESAPGIPVQVIGTTVYPVPNACSQGAVNNMPENTVAQFGANGIIGIGLFDYDCGTACDSVNNNPGWYYTCSAGSCTQAAVPVADQSVNPVFKLAAVNGITDNNGVIIELPAVGASGAATASGTLVFGIGTQANNALAPGATVMTTDDFYGFVSTSFNGSTFPQSYLDSGSNALYFDDSSIPICTQSSVQGFFCPASADSLSATITGLNGQAVLAPFTVGDALTLRSNNPSFAAYSNLAGSGNLSGAQTFDFGLPFFFGRTVFMGIDGVPSPLGTGPFTAY